MQITGAHESGPFIPADAVAVMVNLTYTGGGTGADGWITAFPAGGSKPNASNINKSKVDTVANLVAVRIGDDGKISIANSGTPVHLLGDIAGYFIPGAGAPGPQGEQGEQGVPGEPGEPGRPGEEGVDGSTCSVSMDSEAMEVTVACTDGTVDCFSTTTGEACPVPNPNPPADGFLAMAWINLDGVAGYGYDAGDVFVGGFYDLNGNCVTDAGDEFRTGAYPKNVEASEFGKFTVTSHSLAGSTIQGPDFVIHRDTETYFQIGSNDEGHFEFYEGDADFTVSTVISDRAQGNMIDPASPSQPSDTLSFANLPTDLIRTALFTPARCEP